MTKLKSIVLGVIGASLLAGCTVYEPAPRHYREVYYDDGYDPGYVEVVPARPYVGAVWVGGYYGYYGHHRSWHPGRWR